MRLSMLDQAPVPAGHTAKEALENSVKLAKLGDELGYHRIWMAEHHSSRSLASSAPEITAAHLAAKTERIRVGTGGVMMMHYSALKVAEVFNTLSALNPGRIDFGAGRAPGGDNLVMYAMAQGRRPMLDEQYDKLQAILDLMRGQESKEAAYKGVFATPYEVPLPEAWLLGSTGNSARQAARLGVGYSFAQFFNGEATKEIFDAYRDRFEPSYYMAKPEISVTYAATVAETKEEAEYRGKPVDLSRLFLMKGRIQPTMSPEQAKDFPLTEMDKASIEHNRRLHLVGTPKEIAQKLYDDQELYGFDEAMINSNQYDIKHRLECYTLLAKECGTK